MLPSTQTDSETDEFLRQPLEDWLPVLREICEITGLPKSEFSRFYWSQAFGIGSTHVIKLRPPRSRLMPLKEQAVLENLGDLPIEVPTVVAGGDMNDWRWLAFTRVHGQELSEWRNPGLWPTLVLDHRLALSRQLGDVVSCLHRQTTVDLNASMFDGFYWRWREPIDTILTDHKGLPISQSLIENLQTYLVGSEIPSSDRSLLHFDLRAGNFTVMETNSGWKLSGLFDFEDAQIGPVEWDFLCLFLDFFQSDARLIETFIKAYRSHNELDVSNLSERLMVAFLRLIRNPGRHYRRYEGLLGLKNWEDVRKRMFPVTIG